MTNVGREFALPGDVEETEDEFDFDFDASLRHVEAAHTKGIAASMKISEMARKSKEAMRTRLENFRLSVLERKISQRSRILAATEKLLKNSTPRYD